MAETISMEKMYGEILALRKEVHDIRNRMIKIDVITTPEEEARLEEPPKLYKQGKLRDLKI